RADETDRRQAVTQGPLGSGSCIERTSRPRRRVRRRPPADLFHRQDDRSPDRVCETEPTAQILKRLAEAVERGNHVRPAGGQSLQALPFGDDAIPSLARLDDVGVAHAQPALADVSMSVEKGVFPTGLHLETHNVERSHHYLQEWNW